MNRLAFVTLFIVSAVTRVENSSAQPKIPDDILYVNIPSDVAIEYASRNNQSEPVAWQCTETCDYGGRMFKSSKAKTYAEDMTRLALLPPPSTRTSTSIVTSKLPDTAEQSSIAMDERAEAHINGEERLLDLAKRGAVKTLSPFNKP